MSTISIFLVYIKSEFLCFIEILSQELNMATWVMIHRTILRNSSRNSKSPQYPAAGPWENTKLNTMGNTQYESNLSDMTKRR
ncbi:MAG: hypothetical protein CBC09_07770 [Cellvibrionales bacterium TMED49]|nr:MAG: hypothetical protein CBC09_07770 [Cellvibrionales bacterium TMED49]